MASNEERLAVLEEASEKGEALHGKLLTAIGAIKLEVAGLQTFLSTNGGVTVSIRQGKVKFAGSVSIKLLTGILGTGGSGLGWLVGRVFGAW